MMISNTAIAALISTCIISLAPNLFLFLFPNYGSSLEGKRSRDSIVLSVGQAIAAGGLLGDVFLHMIPHCMEHSHDGEEIGVIILAGFCVFFFFDIFVRESSSAEDHHHHHGHDAHHSSEQNKTKTAENRNGTTADSSIQSSGTFSHTVILSLAADALHNFMDGIAIGTSYATSSPSSSSSSSSSPLSITSITSLLKSRGGLASLSILLHEIPHELGDFAILVDAGFSKTGAITAQFATAVAAVGGTVVGLVAAEMKGWGEGVMLPFTAGGFVYLAAVSILPEVLEGRVGVRRRLCQIVAFGVGVAFMWLVSVLEQHDDHGHDHGKHDLHHDHSHDHRQHGEL